MAIKIGGTTVVDDSRNITNVDNATLSGTLTLNSVGAMKIPTGNTAERPLNPVDGMIRFNTDKNAIEVYSELASDFIAVTNSAMLKSYSFFANTGSTHSIKLGQPESSTQTVY